MLDNSPTLLDKLKRLPTGTACEMDGIFADTFLCQPGGGGKSW